jgi:ABC-2 type transport system permease protein
MGSLVHSSERPYRAGTTYQPDPGFFWHLGMYLRLLGVQLRSQMSYRLSFWMELASTGLANGVYFLSVALIIQRFGSIGGWSLGEIAFLSGLMETSFGAMDMIFSGFDDSDFSQVIRLGRFDQILLRPVNAFWQVLGSRFLLRRFGRIIEGVLIILYALSVLDVHWTIGKLIYLPIVFFSQVLAMG